MYVNKDAAPLNTLSLFINYGLNKNKNCIGVFNLPKGNHIHRLHLLSIYGIYPINL